MRSFLNEGDSHKLTHPDADKTKANFFGRRLGHEVSSKLDAAFFGILDKLGIASNGPDMNEADMTRLAEIESRCASSLSRSVTEKRLTNSRTMLQYDIGALSDVLSNPGLGELTLALNGTVSSSLA